MSDYCRGRERVPPYTAGCWAFLHRNEDRLRTNHRMRQPMRGLDRLAGLDAVVEQERARGAQAP